MDDYLPHQIYELTTNKLEEEYQGGDEIPKVNDIDSINQDGNYDSYICYIGAKVQLPDGSGNPWIRKLTKRGKCINIESICNFHRNPFLNNQEYKV